MAALLTTIFDNQVPTVPAAPPKASSSGYPAYSGANLTRLNADWIGSLLSSDDEIRTSLKRLRARCRQLHNNNDYAQRFVNLVKQNVVGPNGIKLEAAMQDDAGNSKDKINDELERSWEKWGKVGNATCDRRMSFIDVLNVAFETLVIDGECFIRKVRGFRNDYRFALQFIDADQIDTLHNRKRMTDPDGKVVQNEIRMGIEVDEWNAPVAYWCFDGHPSEGHGRKIRIPAEDMIHLFAMRRATQTRGVPFLITAMSKMNMLGGYEEAEAVATRTAACKMAFLVSKTGDEYAGTVNADNGAKQVTLEPGLFEQLPAGIEPRVVDWQHPNQNFPEFVKAMLRGIAVGLNVSYASLAGDLREVNFSSIRQGVLEEREAWRALQTFAKDHLCQLVYEAWMAPALASRQLKLPASGAADYIDGVTWQARGWTWVDPLKDVTTAIAGRGAGMVPLADTCAQQGKDWRDQIDQIAKEDKYAKERGVELNFARPKPQSVGKDPEETPGQPTKPAPGNEPEDEENDQ
jgi:lambda family phage portal protein